MSHKRFYAGIDLEAIEKNVAGVRQRIPQETMIMAVIKADAYGHGAVEIADFLADKVNWFGVATVEEAVELRKNGCKLPILILGTFMPEDMDVIVGNGITGAITDMERAVALNQAAADAGKIVDVHIKIDTGMSRIGFAPTEDSVKTVLEISKLENINISGIFSHFAKADEVDKTDAKHQLSMFSDFIAELESSGLVIPIKHLANSAGIMEMDCTFNMVRMGIMLYGLYPSAEMKRDYELHPAMKLISHISYVKEIDKGTGISYGHTFTADKHMRIATVPVGYADGYPRCLSNKGNVLINGKRCPIVGRICMDQFMVDVSDISNVSVGDEVVLVGKSGEELISIEDVADNAHSFNYEFVCGISRRVPRVYFYGGKEIKTVSYL